MRIVLANGCFDRFHDGHLQHLREARAMGDILVVALTADGAVNKGEGRPVNTWDRRADLLRELRCVDHVQRSYSAMQAIRTLRPTYFVKGIDYAGNDAWTENVQAVCDEVGTVIRFTSARKQVAP